MSSRFLLICSFLLLINCSFALRFAAPRPEPVIYTTRRPVNTLKPKDNCAALDCPVEKSPFYASDGVECLEVQGKCDLRVRNCEREKAHKPLLKRDDTCKENKPKCDMACPAIYKPVCAEDERTGKTKTISSACSIQTENCANKTKYKMLYNGECRDEPKCDMQCPKKKAPICAKDKHSGESKTFSNECLMREHNCLHKTKYQKLHKGECQDESNCKIPCAKIYAPICAKDKNNGGTKTFSNECLMRVHNCRHQTKYQEVHKKECEEKPKCDRQCPKKKASICAKDKHSGETRTFSNECLMKQHICRHETNYQKLHKGECRDEPECVIICPMIDIPICAKDKHGGKSKTFPNDCLMRVHNCRNKSNYQELHKGNCRNKPKCDKTCTDIYAPICAKNKKSGNTKTYSNKCQMEMANCRHRTNYQKLYKGKCTGEPQKPEPQCMMLCVLLKKNDVCQK